MQQMKELQAADDQQREELGTKSIRFLKGILDKELRSIQREIKKISSKDVVHGIRYISERDFELDDPLDEHTATLTKRSGRYGNIVIHFDTNDPGNLYLMGDDGGKEEDNFLLFDVQVINPKITKHSWVINCACVPFRPISMRFLPAGSEVQELGCFDVGIDAGLDLKVSEVMRKEIIELLDEMDIDEGMARFIEKYGYFRSKKNDMFQIQNMIKFIDDEELLDANAIK